MSAQAVWSSKDIGPTLSRLLPSRSTFENRQSAVGRPGSWARSTDPSGSTSFFSSPKSCCPGLSDTYTAAPLTARAAACACAAGCLDWNMSQSGCAHAQIDLICVIRKTCSSSTALWRPAFCLTHTALLRSLRTPPCVCARWMPHCNMSPSGCEHAECIFTADSSNNKI